MRLAIIALLLTACGTTARPATVMALPRQPAEPIEPVTLDAGDVESVVFTSDAAMIVHRDRAIRRYDASGKLIAARATPPGREMWRPAGGGVAVSSDEGVTFYDESLRTESSCAVPVGWKPASFMLRRGERRWLVERDGAFALLDVRTCAMTQLAPTFASIASEGLVISENGGFAGFDDAQCDTMVVHHLPDMKVARRDHGARHVRGAKGCHATGIADDGTVSWEPWGICAIANVEADAFLGDDQIAVKRDGDDLVFESGVVPWFGCGGRSEIEEPPRAGSVSLAPFDFGSAAHVVTGPKRSLAVYDEHKVVRVIAPTFASARAMVIER